MRFEGRVHGGKTMARITRVHALMAVVLAGFLPCGATDARAAKPPLCSAGRFVGSGSVIVQGETLAIVLGSRKLSIGDACVPARARLMRTKLGPTVRAPWPAFRG